MSQTSIFTDRDLNTHCHADADQTLGPYGLDEVYHEDCVVGMQKLPANCIDVAIADPPYNLSKGGNWSWNGTTQLPGFGGKWTKAMAKWDDLPLSEYIEFTIMWLTQLKRVVRPTGSVWIHGTYHNIGIVNVILQSLEIEIINEVIWYKRNAFPNLARRRLTASHETILWAHTGSNKQRKYLFEYDLSKTLPCPEDRLKAVDKQMRTVWDIPNNKTREELRFGRHPTQKPVRLLERQLRLSSRPGQICLIPFAGSGSVGVAARRCALGFLGFEIDQKYVDIARGRIHGSS